MINNIFSPFYYKKTFDDHYKVRTTLLKHIKSQYEKNPNNQPPSWSCKVHTTQSRRDPIFDKVKGYYEFATDQFLKQIQFPDCRVDISEMWYNAYGSGQWQESHTHHGSEDVYFSAVHFLKYDKNIHPPLTMNNLNRVLMEPRFAGRQTTLDYWHMSKNIEVVEGDIIFFPSLLEHQVNVQETDELRVTVSFNVKIQQNKNRNSQLNTEMVSVTGDHMDFHMDQLKSFLDDIQNII